MYPPKTLCKSADVGPPGIALADAHKELVVMAAVPIRIVLALSEPSFQASNKKEPADVRSSTRSAMIRASYVCKAWMAAV